MDDQTTCGKGLAANAALPAAIGELLAAMARVLDVHRGALDLSDESAQPEDQAYSTLVQQLRGISEQLAATSRSMVGHRDLPMGRHDERKMAGREAIQAFDGFVSAEERMLSRLRETVGEHKAMLEQMRS